MQQFNRMTMIHTLLKLVLLNGCQYPPAALAKPHTGCAPKCSSQSEMQGQWCAQASISTMKSFSAVGRPVSPFFWNLSALLPTYRSKQTQQQQQQQHQADRHAKW